MLSCCCVSATCRRFSVRVGQRHRAAGVLQEAEEAQTSRVDDSQSGHLRLWLHSAGVTLLHHCKVALMFASKMPHGIFGVITLNYNYNKNNKQQQQPKNLFVPFSPALNLFGGPLRTKSPLCLHQLVSRLGVW